VEASPSVEAQLRAAVQSKPPRRPRNRWPFIAGGALAVIAAVGITVGLTAGGSSEADAPAVTTHRPSSHATKPNPKVSASNDSARFFLKFHDTYGDTLKHANTLVERGTDHITDGDFDEAASIAHDVADLYTEMRDGSEGLPGADSKAGRLTIDMLDTCAAALQASSDALSPFDGDKLDASSAQITDCSDKLTDVTDLAEGLDAAF